MNKPISKGRDRPAAAPPDSQGCGATAAPPEEHRSDVRFAELDAQIEAEKAERSHTRAGPRKGERRHLKPPLPRDVRKDIVRFAIELSRKHRDLFKSDPKLKERVARLIRTLLPPKPRRRGRPGIESVSVAIRLLRQFRRQHPDERPEQIWQRIYPKAIHNYGAMSELEQGDARQNLRERVRWRQRATKRKLGAKDTARKIR